VPYSRDIFHADLSYSGHFEAIALEAFRYQYVHNPIYREYCDLMKQSVEKVDSTEKIPFLPISFFKSHEVVSYKRTGKERCFLSSGTSGHESSRHFIKDLSIYERSLTTGFRIFHGDPEDRVIFSLLPSYLEREGSSLVFMMEKLMSANAQALGGFFMKDHEELIKRLRRASGSGSKIMLFGVSYALLDLAEHFKFDLAGNVIVETGGMKGKRDEILREELHDRLCKAFNVDRIHSEYGMTELMSQAWSDGKGVFRCPPWMKVFTHDTGNPLESVLIGKTGAINIIDLANIHSCCFIATDDLGKMNADGSFEILGRFDNAEQRGCSLMYE